ncbi:hypothetical protein C5167_017837 [Papaver somniferum]|uniref:Uncharacterized protein n=1 Tax=Papaver somniferum TaxID=3469 RepID=A0A4Y7INW7_PAPSO|nr:hypothetical protein C5167_017837 [Papaver somniferum]
MGGSSFARKEEKATMQRRSNDLLTCFPFCTLISVLENRGIFKTASGFPIFPSVIEILLSGMSASEDSAAAAALAFRHICDGPLIERALVILLPKEVSFPYIIHVDTDVKDSDGSTSMATVCAGSKEFLQQHYH